MSTAKVKNDSYSAQIDISGAFEGLCAGGTERNSQQSLGPESVHVRIAGPPVVSSTSLRTGCS